VLLVNNGANDKGSHEQIDPEEHQHGPVEARQRVVVVHLGGHLLPDGPPKGDLGGFLEEGRVLVPRALVHVNNPLPEPGEDEHDSKRVNVEHREGALHKGMHRNMLENRALRVKRRGGSLVHREVNGIPLRARSVSGGHPDGVKSCREGRRRPGGNIQWLPCKQRDGNG